MNRIQQILKQVYSKRKNQAIPILLACTLEPKFTRKDIFNIIDPIGIIDKGKSDKARKKSFDSCFDGFVDKTQDRGFFGSLDKIGKKGKEDVYTLNEQIGMARIIEKGFLDAYYLLQSLTDTSSEEPEHPDELQPPTEQTQLIEPQQFSVAEKLEATCDHLKETLIFKNSQYGSSSLAPIGIFELPRTAKVQARLEDKISRLAQVSRSGDIDALKDTLLDLAGYSILYLVILEEEK